MGDLREYKKTFEEVIEVFSKRYSCGGMSRISGIEKEFNNSSYKRQIAREIYLCLERRNSCSSTRVWGIDNLLKKELEQEVLKRVFERH